MKELTRISILGACLAISAPVVNADVFPERPITIIVPYAPGASGDGVARILSKKLSQSLGKPVIVDNKPGGGGAVGLLALEKAAPDGHTIAIGASGAIAIGPHLPDAPPLDPQKNLAPIAKVADVPLVLVAGGATNIKSVQDLIKQSKSNPQGVSYGTTGQYTTQHMAGELLASMTKANLVPVPYRGSAPALVDVLGGQIPIAIVDLTAATSHIKSGKIVALGVTNWRRSKIAPEIPIIAESGVTGYSAPAWLGVFAPAKTPAPVLNRLTQEIKVAMSDSEVVEKISGLSVEPSYLGPEDFKTFIATESKKWAGVVASMPKPAK